MAVDSAGASVAGAAARRAGQLALNESEWLVTRASERGKGHIEGGLPCQDWCAARTTPDGAWVAAVACDGAGSAARAEEGAKTVAEGFADRLIGLTPRIDAQGPGPWLRDDVHRALIELRDALRAKGDINQYDCTVVGVLMGRTGGIFVHIGDGLALGSTVHVEGDGADAPVALWRGLVKSLPENGEFANETVFLTENDWYAHLRTTPLSRDLDILVLTTDGMMPFLMLKGFEPNSAFLDPVVTTLLSTADPRERERVMRSWLASPDTYQGTDDDKTLVVLLRRRLAKLAGRPVVPHAPAEPAKPPKPPLAVKAPVPSPAREPAVARALHEVPQALAERAAPAMRPGWLWTSLALSAAALLVAFGALLYGHAAVSRLAASVEQLQRALAEKARPATGAPARGTSPQTAPAPPQPAPQQPAPAAPEGAGAAAEPPAQPAAKPVEKKAPESGVDKPQDKPPEKPARKKPAPKTGS